MLSRLFISQSVSRIAVLTFLIVLTADFPALNKSVKDIFFFPSLSPESVPFPPPVIIEEELLFSTLVSGT